MKIGIFAAAALVFTTGAMAAAPGDESDQASAAEQQPVAADAGTEAPAEKKVCRTERATGSLTRRTRVCMTAAQWREINSKTMRGVSEMQGQGSGGQTVQNNAGAGG